MLTQPEKDLITESFARLAANGPQAVQNFYDTLFERAPSVRPLFGNDMDLQSEKLFNALQLAVSSLKNLDDFRRPLRTLGALHVDWGANPDHYPIVADALIETLAASAPQAWSTAHDHAWAKLLDFISEEMIRGARDGVPDNA